VYDHCLLLVDYRRVIKGKKEKGTKQKPFSIRLAA
jgi:hypothetical protein